MTHTQELQNKTNIIDGKPLKICFVCTGNTCRSPMAMAVLNHYGKNNYVAESAGIMADSGAPITPKASTDLKNSGIQSTPDNNYDSHTARQLTPEIMEECDRIVAVGPGHAMMIIQAFPQYASKVTSFDENITDPFGQSQEVYDKCLSDIIKAIKHTFVLDINNDNE